MMHRLSFRYIGRKNTLTCKIGICANFYFVLIDIIKFAVFDSIYPESGVQACCCTAPGEEETSVERRSPNEQCRRISRQRSNLTARMVSFDSLGSHESIASFICRIRGHTRRGRPIEKSHVTEISTGRISHYKSCWNLIFGGFSSLDNTFRQHPFPENRFFDRTTRSVWSGRKVGGPSVNLQIYGK